MNYDFNSDKPFRKLELLLREHGYNSANLAIITSKSLPMSEQRLRNPGEYCLFDLVDIVKSTELTFDEIMETIRGDFE